MRVQGGIHLILITAVALSIQPVSALSQADTSLSREQKEQFLQQARVTRSQRTGKGRTNPYRLTLTDGEITHDASFQTIFERRNSIQFADGTTEINYVDSYLYNIAAYRLAVMLGLGSMMPVTVERKWNGMIGSLSWWLPVQMDEAERMREKIRPPDVPAHNRQMHKMRVFAELVYDTDRNIGNVLIGENWEIYMIDFTRAFRTYRDLKDARNLQRCSRDLYLKLQQLDRESLRKETDGFLTGEEVKAVMARRDLIVEYFNKLISEKGEEAILYD